ncbi:hypothetical protein [Arsenicibacter rosenii]|uniref:Uncharacterized protein n=1 Tax=Arsenicibacter rosenii TaxID=1750698 RepID=A0A1S2VQV5_9BACT|nr:hypothetical protein [Arsenicibacter rosenii]OIN61159.1 hypothetical protein BLX24_03615 [Arsenicibacter rosenii]
MLDIRLEGESVDIKPGTQLVLERFNPMFDFDTIQGAKVLDFNLPDTPANRRILGYAHLPQAGNPRRRWYCEKYLSTNLIERGFIKLREVNPEFNLYFTQNLGELFGDYQDVLLSEMLELGSEAAPAAPVADPDLTTAKYCLPSVLNPSFYGNVAVAGYDGIMNQYASGYMTNARVPMFFVRWVLARIGQLTGWTFRGDWWDSNVGQRLIFYNLHSLDQAATMTYCNHLPPISPRNLLKEIRKMFNLYLDFDVRRKVITMDFVDDVLRQPTLYNWTEKGDPRHTKLPDLHGRLELSFDIDQNDATMKPLPLELDKYTTPETAENEGGALIPVKCAFSTLLTDGGSGFAHTDQQGYSPLNKDSKPVATARFLIWNGMQNGAPRATASDGNMILNWSGANGLAKKYWRVYEGFRSRTFALKKMLYLSPADLASFSMRQKIHVRGVDYVIGDMKAGISDSNLIPCETTLWRW